MMLILQPTQGQSAYDAVLYGSDSDLSDSDAEEEPKQNKKGAKRRKQQETFIREGSENPVDLLDQNAFSHISSRQPITQSQELTRLAKAASRASSFKSNQDGRMIIEEPNPTPPKNKAPAVEYNAYAEATESN